MIPVALNKLQAAIDYHADWLEVNLNAAIKMIRWLALLPILLSTFALAQSPLEPRIFTLDGAWSLSGPDAFGAIPATVPGCVHTDLRRAGKIPDPFYRDNEKQIAWVSKAAWTYTRHFDLPAEFVKSRHIELRCLGLETLAAIRINGAPIGATDNMFRTWTFDVRHLLKSGDNTIQIQFLPLDGYIKKKASQSTGPGTATNGIAEVRVEPCSNGWDFGPKFLTFGIWRPIELLAWDEARLTDVYASADLRETPLAKINVQVQAQIDDAANQAGGTSAQAAKSTPLSARCTVTLRGEEAARGSCDLSPDGRGSLCLPIAQPELW